MYGKTVAGVIRSTQLVVDEDGKIVVAQYNVHTGASLSFGATCPYSPRSLASNSASGGRRAFQRRMQAFGDTCAPAFGVFYPGDKDVACGARRGSAMNGIGRPFPYRSDRHPTPAETPTAPHHGAGPLASMAARLSDLAARDGDLPRGRAAADGPPPRPRRGIASERHPNTILARARGISVDCRNGCGVDADYGDRGFAQNAAPGRADFRYSVQ